MKRIAITDNWNKRIKWPGKKFRREGRRICSVFLCASLVAGNCTVTPFSAFAEDESGEYEYEFERSEIKSAIREAVDEGALDQELNLIGTYADEYADLLEADGSLYEVFPEAIEEDRDRDRALDLRIFARIEGSIPVDDTYVFDGSEELIFLLENKTDKVQTAAIGIDGMWTDEIEVLPAASVAVDGESGGPGVVAGAAAAETDAAVAGDTVISGDSAISGGSVSGSGGSSGGSGSGGSVSGSKTESTDETVSGTEEEDPAEVGTDGLGNGDAVAVSDSDCTAADDSDPTGENQGTVSDNTNGGSTGASDAQKTADEDDESVTGGTDSTTTDGAEKPDTDSDTDAGDQDKGDTADASGNKEENGSGSVSENTDVTSDDGEKSADNGEDTGSGETVDNNDNTTEDSTSDTNSGSGSNTGSGNSSGSNTGDTDGGSDEDAADNGSTGEQTASISIHRTAYLSAPLATDSNVEKRATPSDASASDADHSIDGELLNAVLLDGHGAVAFVTTAADLKLDVIMLSEQEMTCESEDGDQDYLVTVTGWLPDGGYVTAEPVDVEIEGKTVLLALDISICDDNGEVYEPAEDTISVKITSSEIVSEETGSNYDVYYVPEEGEPELVPVTESEEGDVTFEAEHFSVYAVTSSDTVIASGFMDNANGDIDAITWQLIMDEEGDYTLYVSGEGAIPDETSKSEFPWADYSSYSVDLVFEDGITRVGNYAFSGFALTGIEFSSTIESIGTQSFSYISKLKSVVIPGTLREIGSSAFIYGSVTDITLDDGVTTIGSSAFGNTTSGGSVITIPASVTSIGNSAFWIASGFVVADGNPVYWADKNGVLYKYNSDDGSTSTLVDYPNRRVAASWTIPEFVTEIQSGAFYNYLSSTVYTEKLYVINYGNGLTLPSACFDCSTFAWIYIDDGVTFAGSRNFYNSKSLQYVRLPEDCKIVLDGLSFKYDASLTYLKITSLTTSIQALALAGTTSLQTIYYDAASATISTTAVDSTTGYYDLIIGTDVDTLPANFSALVSRASSLTFEGENTLYIEEGALSGASSPYSSLSGWIYVDDYGVIYQLNPDAGTAALVYIPAAYLDSVTAETTQDENTIETFTTSSYSLTSVRIPAAITVADSESDATVAGRSFSVTTIAANAAKYAENLVSITFEKASQITTLGMYALANCPLSLVTDEATNTSTTVEETAEALFGLSGSTIFYNTHLTGSEAAVSYSESMNGSRSTSVYVTGEVKDEDGNVSTKNLVELSVNVTSGTDWVTYDETNGTGGYTALTGQNVSFNINAGNVSGTSQTYRVYIRATDDDCSTGWYVGKTSDLSGITVTCHETNDPDVVYLEFTLTESQTINFNIDISYPNVTSDGGGVEVWGALIGTDGLETYATRTDATTSTDEEGNTVTGTETVIDSVKAYWGTEPVPYTVAKNSSSSPTLTTDAEGIVRLNGNLSYTITLAADEESTDDAGKDYVKYAVYTDEIILPTGVEWDEEVLAAIEAGTYSVRNKAIFAGTKEIASLSCSGTNLNLIYITAAVNEDGNVVISWRVQNTAYTSSDMSTNTIKMVVYAESLHVDLRRYNQSSDSTEETESTSLTDIRNIVTVDVTYTFSEKCTTTAEKDITLPNAEGAIAVSKSVTDASYLGEDLTYTLSVYNTGALPYSITSENEITLNDTLSNTTYISTENMEKMLAEATASGDTLTITITNAVVGTGKSVTTTDGEETAYINSGNSNLGDEQTVTLTITCDTAGANSSGSGDDESNEETRETVSAEVTGYTVVAKSGNRVVNTLTGENLAKILQQLGYGVTKDVVYSCVWVLNGTDGSYSLAIGTTDNYYIYATVKDTFQYIGADWPGEYPKSTAISFNNQAGYLKDGSTQIAKSGSASTKVKREAYISKSVSKDGVILGSAPTASDGDVLEYTLAFEHYGNGTYEDLPMVDDIYGSQYLLVPVNLNEENASQLSDLNQMPVGEVSYYILTEGDYTNVVVGVDEEDNNLTAATITVSAATEEDTDIILGNGTSGSETLHYTGVHTEIKWYFDSLDGEEYTKTIAYQTVVNMGDSLSYTIGNIVWMNDRETTRIYASTWGGGTIIDYDKEIVTERGTTSDEDIINEDGISSISSGEAVTYRLTLSSNGTENTDFVVRGAKIADALPETYGIFKWTKENVSIEVVASDGVTGYQDLVNTEKWSIQTEYGALGNEEGSAFYICWDEEVTVTFTADAYVYLYVTLTFPSTSDLVELENGTTTDQWSQYVEAVGGAMVNNTFYVYQNPATVSHVLKKEGSVRLQKGVYALLRSSTMGTSLNSYNEYYATGTTRSYYNTQDTNYRYVLYYVELYNGGSTLLYLNDLYDTLPDGFSYMSLVANGNAAGGNPGRVYNVNSITTASSNSYYLVEQQTGVTYMNAGITKSANADGQLVFTVSSGSGTNPVKYDEDREQYYLAKGEAIVFGYICCTGTSDDGDKTTATNTVAMSYTDYTGAGVSVFNNVAENDVQADDVIAASGGSQYADPNDGDCNVTDSNTISDTFTDDTGNSDWLISSVKLEKGNIKPGVIKKTVSYTSPQTGTTSAYENHVSNSDIVNWEITLQNAGEMTIMDYKVTDVMPYPYLFTGDVTYAIYDSNSADEASGTLFTVESVTLKDGTTIKASDDSNTMTSLDEISYVTISYTNTSSTTSRTNVSVGADTATSLTVTGSRRTFELRFDLDENGNIVMEIEFTDVALAIPESGQVVLTCSSYYTSSSVEPETCLNQVTLTPMTQTIRSGSIQSGTAVTDSETGKITGVYNVSPVTVAIGYFSDAYKTVTEVSDQSNTAVSTDTSDNSIVLSSADSTFAYTLTVENPNSTAMEKLVLVDNLPYEGDHYAFNDTLDRNSEFAVLLADNKFAIVVTTEQKVSEWDDLTPEITYDTDGETILSYTYTLTSDMYSVEFSTTLSGNYSTADQNGTSSGNWESAENYKGKLSAVKSIRVIITGTDSVAVPANSAISVSFTAKVDENTEPGEVAWNNFGYHYYVTTGNSTVELEAMPLVVGVKVPSAPELTKKLVGLNGEEYKATENQMFTFVIYEGEELENSESYTTVGSLEIRLKELGRPYKIVTQTVTQGSSESEKLIMTGDHGLGTDAEENQINWWTWEDGKSYTIAEFLNNDNYSLQEWSSGSSAPSGSSSYTFEYDASSTLSLVCTNICEKWSLNLTKVDANSYDEESGTYTTTLNGAVFALYTQNKDQKISDTDYQKLTSTYQLDDEYTEGEGDSAVTWYLYGVKETDLDGGLNWLSLTEESYYLVEIKAPDGYNLNVDGYVVRRGLNTDNSGEGFYEVTWNSNEASITVTNEAGSELPETGGPGTIPFRVAGLLLMSVSAYLIYDTLKRRRISAS